MSDYRIIIGCDADASKIDSQFIIEAAAIIFDLSVKDLITVKQRPKNAHTRRLCMYILKVYHGMPNLEIAGLFSPAIKQNDHTAISYGLKQVKINYKDCIKDIEAIIQKAFYLTINNALRT